MRMRSLCIGLTLGALGLVAASAASATTWTETALHAFCASAGCSDGGDPAVPVLKSGNVLYGVTSGGGSHSGGIVYSYDTSTSTYTVLYNFCSTHVVGHATICSDGESPATRLIIDTSGNLYGTTQLGGNVANAGTVWELVKPVGAGSWTYKSIYKFCPDLVGSVGCADGDDPLTGLTYAGAESGAAYDGSSLLFGATYVGGSDAENSYGNGVMYVLQLSGTTWSQNAFYAFCPSCSESCTGCGDGVRPYGDIVLDANNKFWGTTISGGRQGRGMTYELSPSSSNLWTASWTETVLFNFCWSGVSGCAEGEFPNGVIQDASGNLYGTAAGGNSHGGGLLYKLASGSCLEFGGDGPYWCETVLHDFCTTSACNDGSGPNGDLVMDSSGNIYGTTGAGGSHAIVTGGAGTVWKYNGTAESVLYKFCPSGTCTDGDGPSAGVIEDSSGNFFGVTGMGGNSSNEGVIFELSPS